MSLTSFDFFVFLLVSIVIYYLLNNKYKKWWLLVCSMFFYYKNCANYKLFFLIIFVTVVTYTGALLIEKASGKNKSLFVILSISLLVLSLLYTKYLHSLVSVISHLLKIDINYDFIKVVSAIGISYYTLSAIGYLIDVLWGNIKAEKNVFNLLLFISFFPQLVSGPVTRYKSMVYEINKEHGLSYDNVSHGLRRMIFGYFKKLVISETFVLTVNAVFDCPLQYNIVGIAIGVLCYAITLYTDFSGCMDIVLGVASLYDIRLPENFNAPLMSKSLKEFWQRWHITLGAWFKDYVMYPIQASRLMVKISKFCKIKFGKKFGKKIPFYISMAILWTLLGIWHGAEPYYFVASGVIPCIFLVTIDLFSKTNKQNNSNIINLIKIIITLFLVCVCWYVVCCKSLKVAFDVAYQCIIHIFDISQYQFYPYTIEKTDLVIMALSIPFLYYIEYKQYNGKTVFDILDNCSFGVRYALIVCELLLILYIGKVGTTTFIYFKF